MIVMLWIVTIPFAFFSIRRKETLTPLLIVQEKFVKRCEPSAPASIVQSNKQWIANIP